MSIRCPKTGAEVDIKPPYRIFFTPSWIQGPVDPFCGLLRFSKAGQRKVALGNFEFSVAEPQKQIPITNY